MISYLIRVGSRPDWAIPGLLNVVLVGTLHNVKSAILQKGSQPLIAYNLMEPQWFIRVVLNRNLHANTGPSFDVLIGRELNTADDVSDLEIRHTNSCLRANEVL